MVLLLLQLSGVIRLNLTREQQRAIHSKNNIRGIRTPVNWDSTKLRINVGTEQQRAEKNTKFLHHASDYDLQRYLIWNPKRGKTRKDIENELYQNPHRHSRYAK